MDAVIMLALRIGLLALLWIFILVALLSGVVPPAPAFLIATTITLAINFSGPMEQGEALRRHAPNALAVSIFSQATCYLNCVVYTWIYHLKCIQTR